MSVKKGSATSAGDGDARAQETWSRTLDQIPTRFGRLVYLAGLRNPNSGAYRHHGMEQAFGAERSGKVIRESHEAIFSEWLSLDLRGQHEDLAGYLNEVGEERARVLETWGSLEPYLSLPPAAAGGAQRLLYETDLEVILELLRGESAASPSS